MHDDRIRETELACSLGDWHNYPVKSEGKQLRSSGVAGVQESISPEKPFREPALLEEYEEVFVSNHLKSLDLFDCTANCKMVATYAQFYRCPLPSALSCALRKRIHGQTLCDCCKVFRSEAEAHTESR